MMKTVYVVSVALICVGFFGLWLSSARLSGASVPSSFTITAFKDWVMRRHAPEPVDKGNGWDKEWAMRRHSTSDPFAPQHEIAIEGQFADGKFERRQIYIWDFVNEHQIFTVDEDHKTITVYVEAAKKSGWTVEMKGQREP